MDAKAWQSIGAALSLLLPIIIVIFSTSIIFSCAYGTEAYLDPVTNTKKKIGIARRIALFLMGASFGSTIGCFMGASASLPAANILNTIVPLISGYIAYITSKDLAVEVKLFVPGVVTILLFNLLLSFWFMRMYFAE